MGAGKGKPGLILGEGCYFARLRALGCRGTETRLPADAASSRREYQLRNYSATDIAPPCQEMAPRLFDQGIEAVRPQGLIGQ